MVCTTESQGGGVGDEYARATGQEAKNALVKEMGTDVCVDCREHVVKNHDVRIGVASAGKVDALLLAAGKVYPLLADLGCISRRQQLEVITQRARVEHCLVTRGVKGGTKDDVVAERRVCEPGALRAVRDFAGEGRAAGEAWNVAEECVEEAGLATASRAADEDQLARLDRHFNLGECAGGRHGRRRGRPCFGCGCVCVGGGDKSSRDG
mmetsp:Transcript_72203/g.143236  ORF Transcript_72203/g.143236 Transcript_72203/m.143236 type:complete len:209 (-) Transcript_72203:2089-2715(-)